MSMQHTVRPMITGYLLDIIIIVIMNMLSLFTMKDNIK